MNQSDNIEIQNQSPDGRKEKTIEERAHMSDILSSKQQTVYNDKQLSAFGSDDKIYGMQEIN